MLGVNSQEGELTADHNYSASKNAIYDDQHSEKQMFSVGSQEKLHASGRHFAKFTQELDSIVIENKCVSKHRETPFLGIHKQIDIRQQIKPQFVSEGPRKADKESHCRPDISIQLVNNEILQKSQPVHKNRASSNFFYFLGRESPFQNFKR